MCHEQHDEHRGMALEDEAVQQAREHDENETTAKAATACEHDSPSEHDENEMTAKAATACEHDSPSDDTPSQSSWGSCWSSFMEMRDKLEPDEDDELCRTEVRWLVAASRQEFGQSTRSHMR